MPVVVTLLSIVLQAIYRYLFLAYSHAGNPLKEFIHKRKAAVIAFTWVASGICLLPCAVQGDLTVFPYRDVCYVLAISDHTIVYSLLGVLFCVPAVIIPVLYILIYVALRRATSRVASEDMKRSRQSRDAKVTLRLFFIYVLYVVAYMPTFSGAFIPIHLAVDPLFMRKMTFVTFTPLILITALNPLIY